MNILIENIATSALRFEIVEFLLSKNVSFRGINIPAPKCDTVIQTDPSQSQGIFAGSGNSRESLGSLGIPNQKIITGKSFPLKSKVVEDSEDVKTSDDGSNEDNNTVVASETRYVPSESNKRLQNPTNPCCENSKFSDVRNNIPSEDVKISTFETAPKTDFKMEPMDFEDYGSYNNVRNHKWIQNSETPIIPQYPVKRKIEVENFQKSEDVSIQNPTRPKIMKERELNPKSPGFGMTSSTVSGTDNSGYQQLQTIQNPQLQYPQIQNPHIQNPQIQNPHIQNPQIQNPHIQNSLYFQNLKPEPIQNPTSTLNPYPVDLKDPMWAHLHEFCIQNGFENQSPQEIQNLLIQNAQNLKIARNPPRRYSKPDEISKDRLLQIIAENGVIRSPLKKSKRRGV